MARSSLAAVGQWIQFQFCCTSSRTDLLHVKETTTRNERDYGPSCRGEHALYRLYKTLDDKWIMFSPSLLPVTWEHFDHGIMDNLSSCLLKLRGEGLSVTSEFPEMPYDKALEKSLESIFNTYTCEYLLMHFKDYEIPAVRLASMKDIAMENVVQYPDVPGGSFQFIMEGVNEPSSDGTSILYATDHIPISNESSGFVYQTAMVPIRTRSKTGIRSLPPAQKYGASTRSILKGLGYTVKEIDNLIRGGNVSDGWCDQYFP